MTPPQLEKDSLVTYRIAQGGAKVSGEVALFYLTKEEALHKVFQGVGSR